MTDDRDSVEVPWGLRLRRWRDETMQWSQQDLVDQLVRLAFESKEERGTLLDVRLVSRWESGAVRRPQAVYRRLLAKLGAPAPDPPVPRTATDPRSRVVHPAVTATVDLASVVQGDDEGEGDDPVLRRDLLRVDSSLALSGLLASVAGLGPKQARPSSEVVDELRHRLTTLRRLDDTLGGGDTYRLFATEAELTAHLLKSPTNRECVHRDLLALHAEQSQQAGWAAFDAGWHDLANDDYRRSHAAAMEAGDTGLAANALAFLAYQQLGLNRPARALSERSIQVASQPDVDSGVQALLYSRAAWTFAVDGDAQATARCLGLAEEALQQADGHTPDYAAWVDETELSIMTGRCWTQLRRPLRAVPVLESALGRYSSVHARDKALYSSWLADSYIDAGEIEQAVAILQASFGLVRNVASVRPRQRLRAVAARLSGHKNLAVVRDLLGSHALDPFDILR
jgi:tetratricopeptide (TPR) repeat protein